MQKTDRAATSAKELWRGERIAEKDETRGALHFSQSDASLLEIVVHRIGDENLLSWLKCGHAEHRGCERRPKDQYIVAYRLICAKSTHPR